MAFLLDTDIVIHLRDSQDDVWTRVGDLAPPLMLSVINRVELENGVYRDPKWTDVRRAALDKILTQVSTIDFGRNNSRNIVVSSRRSVIPGVRFATG